MHRGPADRSPSETFLTVARGWRVLKFQLRPVRRSVSHVNLEFLLEAERVVEEGHGVVLVNTDEAGTLFVTNFRLLFLSDGTRNIVPRGTILLATIEKFNKMVVKIQSAPCQTDQSSSRRLLQIIDQKIYELAEMWNKATGSLYLPDEKERQQCGVYEACGCLWAYLADLRSSEGSSHAHYNLFYDPLKHNGPLLPPAAALAPTLWPQFHLRWACPSESQAGELEAECRNMAIKFSELQKAKEVAEMKVKEYSVAMETLNADLRNEKQLSSSAMNLAKRASKESAVVKRAIESLGCRVNFTDSCDCTVDVESSNSNSTKIYAFSS
ncbi:hypothetical protein CRYUN_Cryun09bG0078100 [Craigia yunnanensis]